MDTVVMHWLVVGLMASTFILVMKLIFTQYLKVPGITPLVGSI